MEIIDSLMLSGMDQITYSVWITYTAGGCSETITIPLIIKNPCKDPDFVKIIAPRLDTLEYTINSGEKDFVPHDPFTLMTSPIDHLLCGRIMYEACYEDEPI